MAILFCGVIMYFFTNMSKVLIPGTVFNELQSAGLDVKSISALGAFYMYAYAGSQLLAGIFSDRYGGVRILLIGGSMFTAGTIGFPFMEKVHQVYIFHKRKTDSSGSEHRTAYKQYPHAAVAV